MSQEFLPLCDVLFNIISLASYFCDVVFDVVTVYTLYDRGQAAWFALSLACIMLSLFICQLLSLKWYFHKNSGRDFQLSVVALVHLIQFGVLWRYFKLFLPVDLKVVKNEVRDLCMLRLIHAFCEAAPMLLIQLYIIWLKPSSADITDLNLVSTLLSLFNLCWALASFSKNVRRRNIHKLVLTWLGVIFQFFWRLGTVSARVVVLTVYATLYHYWVFLVIFLHWLTMFLWLISPKNVFHGESISTKKKTLYSVLIAFVYIFCYINLQEINSRQKMLAFYFTMFLENSLLMAVFLCLKGHAVWFHNVAVVIAWGGFSLGIGFMILYYRYFHIQHLKHGLASDVALHCEDCVAQTCETHPSKPNGRKPPLAESGHRPAIFPVHGHFQNGIPGVFNCRLNPAFKRKKKKPSSFVPPPPALHKSVHPFWRKLPPKSCSSDHDSSVGSRVNIQQKLQEKKKQQLQELKEIEEEIKQGKLKRPMEMGDQDMGTLRQPIPHSKKQPWSRPAESPAARPPPRRSQTPEILLIPDSLDCDYPLTDASSNLSGASNAKMYPRPGTARYLPPADIYHPVPSDLDSQISLPRSFTLPREFRYYRRSRPPRKPAPFTPSNNSSDGDVDSADDNETYVPFPSHRGLRPQPYRACAGQLHETKL